MNKRFILFFLLILLFSCDSEKGKNPLEAILNTDKIEIKKVMENLDKHEVQILYTQVIKNRDSSVDYNSHGFQLDSSKYFYPASTVKMPVAILALQRLNELKLVNEEIDKNHMILIDSSRVLHRKAYDDATNPNGSPSISRYIQKLFVVSDNDAYNALYEFLGQDYINTQLRKKNIFKNSRIITRVGVGGYGTEENKITNPYQLFSKRGEVLFAQKEQTAVGDYSVNITDTSKGLGYLDDDLDSIIMEPFDMSKKNFINLYDLEKSLQELVYPSTENTYNLSKEDRSFLLESMSALPRDYDFLKDNPDYYDSYVKFFMYGDTKETIPDHIKIHNKVGYAYGYLTDCAYIVDTKNDIEFFLTATIHVNENKIYNDGKYEYDDIGIPFLAELGRQVYQYELQH